MQPREDRMSQEASDAATLRHELKCWPPYFAAVLSGDKSFEVRRHDRDFHEGDVLTLREWNQNSQRYTGRLLDARITYLLPGGEFGIEDGYCVLGIEVTGWNEVKE